MSISVIFMLVCDLNHNQFIDHGKQLDTMTIIPN